MMVMTTKVDLKKIVIILAAVAAVVLALILLLGGNDDTAAGTTISSNDNRVKFLTDMGWEVAASPVESTQVKIPEQQSEVYARYNALQKSQGYDLSQYAGKNVMRYVYKINNFPNATDPVYATMLVYKNQVIGGDITDTSAKGTIQGFKKLPAPEPQQSLPPETTVPATT